MEPDKRTMENQNQGINNFSRSPKFSFEPADELQITDPEIIQHLIHDKKKILLEILIHAPLTIMDISKEMDLNPGTVKRHLTDLISAKLVINSHEEFNEKRIILKYYRTVARRFIFHFEWPPK